MRAVAKSPMPVPRGGTLPWLTAVALIGSAACGQGDAGGRASAATMRDSAGIAIVENGDPGAAPDLLASPDPTLSLGVVDGAPEYQLYQVRAAALLSDGTVVVANAGTRDVRFYEADGTYRATVGGAGQGPSDFRYPAGLVIGAGDTVVVQDIVDRVRFTRDGTFVDRQTVDRGRLQSVWGGAHFSEGGTWLPGGTFFAPAFPRETGPPKAGPPFRPQMLVARLGPELARMDTLGVFGGILQQYVQVRAGPRGTMPVVLPFTTNTWWAWGAPDGTIAIGDNAVPQVELFGGDGSRRLVRWHAGAEAVTPEDVEAWKGSVRAAMSNNSRLPDIERGWAQMEIPATKAYYGGLAMGRDGTIWVSAASGIDADPATFLVFAPDGTLKGTVTVPGPFTVEDAGPGWVLGVYRDENRVEFLRRYPLLPS